MLLRLQFVAAISPYPNYNSIHPIPIQMPISACAKIHILTLIENEPSDIGIKYLNDVWNVFLQHASLTHVSRRSTWCRVYSRMTCNKNIILPINKWCYKVHIQPILQSVCASSTYTPRNEIHDTRINEIRSFPVMAWTRCTVPEYLRVLYVCVSRDDYRITMAARMRWIISLTSENP